MLPVMGEVGEEALDGGATAPSGERMVAVGRVTPRSVRLWVRLEAPQGLWLDLEGPDGIRRVGPFSPRLLEAGVAAFTYPDDFPGEAALAPGSRYLFRLITEGPHTKVGSGRFRTSSRTPTDAPDK